MAQATQTQPTSMSFGSIFDRTGESLRRFGARMIEIRQRQANAVVREELVRLGLSKGKIAPHDADANFL